MTRSVRWLGILLLTACSSPDRPTRPQFGPAFAISDAVHEGGTPGFYFLPPMVGQPTFNGTFDADIATLNPQIAICDVTNDANCGGSSATLVMFTTTSTPAITVDPTTPQYQVNWNTQTAGFVAGHTYRVHVTAVVSGSRRELGFADVLLTTTPGEAKRVETGDIIVLQDGRMLPIHVRIETDITCNCWTTKASLTNARDFHGTGVANGVLYAVGGSNGSVSVVATEAYDPIGNAWSTRAPMPMAQVQLAVGVVNNILYAVGGTSSTSYTDQIGTVQAYDPVADVWTTKAPMPTPRRAHAVGVVNGMLYAVGGVNGPYLNTVQAYDPATNTWTSKAPMPTARAHLAVGVVNGVLYAVGGCVNPCTQDVFATVEAYDPTTDMWSIRAPMPTPRAGFGLVALNGILYAVGGTDGTGSPVVGYHFVNTVEAYDPTTDTWTTKASMPTPRGWLAVSVVNGVLYAVGGGNVTDVGPALATVEAYQP